MDGPRTGYEQAPIAPDGPHAGRRGSRGSVRASDPRHAPDADPNPGTAIRRQVVALGMPVLVEQGMLYLVGLSDTILTGRYLGVADLAAVTMSSYLLWLIGSLMTVASAGGTALVARFIGAGDRGGASRMTQQAMMLGFAVGAAFLAVGLPAAVGIVRALGLSGPSAGSAVTYVRIVLLAAPLMACQTVGVACLRGAGDTRTGMKVMAVVNLINVAVSWTLARGLGPIPPLGLAGIAAGTALGYAVGGVILLVVLARGHCGLGLRRSGLRPSWTDLRRLLRVSLPAAGESATNNLCQLWFFALISRLGDTAAAAHGVALRCESLAYLTILAFSVPAGTLTGQYLGAGRPDLAARAARIAWGLGAAVLAALGAILFLSARPMFALFLGDGSPQVADMGVPVLRLVAFALPAFATITVLGGALRGAGDTRRPWSITLLGFLAVRIPLTYALTAPGVFASGLFGAWVAMVADLAFRGVLFSLYFLGGRWKRVEV